MSTSTAKKSAAQLLRPVVENFKRQVAQVIDDVEGRIDQILRVRYDAPPEARPIELPAPRLQLRWAENESPRYGHLCHYEMVFPLGDLDIRNDDKTGFCVVELGRTKVNGGEYPWLSGDGRPYRDGTHSDWDAKMFGGWPIYILAPGAPPKLFVKAEAK